MKTILNPDQAGQTTNTSFGPIEFDAQGKAQVEDEVAALLVTVPGFIEVPKDEPLGDGGQAGTDGADAQGSAKSPEAPRKKKNSPVSAPKENAQ